MKTCFKCNQTKSLSEFYKHPQMPDGVVGKCKECNKVDVRQNYKKTVKEKRLYDSYRHRYSIPRIFSHRYSGIKTRCGKPRSNGNYYKVFGTKFLSKKQWFEWCYQQENYSKFISIYNDWVKSNFLETKSPSIDRINNNLGYVVGNLQWLDKSENCSKYTK